MPFLITLKDRSAEVPLMDWGTGTQNRTQILMTVLQANRIKIGAGDENRITPIVVIEEPESFLHPSAQAEFGKLLQALSTELGIQILASTHSPYMLNQVNPASNILLRRKVAYGKLVGTEKVDTQDAQWMAPFAEHLGVVPPEFERWRFLFGPRGSRVLLVEGDADKEYIEHLRRRYKTSAFDIPEDIDTVAYNGKDALKNVAVLKFLLSKVDKYLITFDLDAAQDVIRPLQSVGLRDGTDYFSVGIAKPGREAIEGLLPDRVLSTVNGRETDLVMQLTSQSGASRREAKQRLKRKYLEEFKKTTQFSDLELEPMSKLARSIRRRFAS